MGFLNSLFGQPSIEDLVKKGLKKGTFKDLSKVLRHKDPALRRQAAHWLRPHDVEKTSWKGSYRAGVLEDWCSLFAILSDAVKPLIEALRDTDADVRAEAAQSLGLLLDLRVERYFQDFKAWLKESDRGEGRYGDPLIVAQRLPSQVDRDKAEEHLWQTAFKDPDTRVRDAAKQALIRICGKQFTFSAPGR